MVTTFTNQFAFIAYLTEKTTEIYSVCCILIPS